MFRSANNQFIRRQFYIGRDQSEFLRTFSYKRNVSQARLVRDAIREFAKNNSKTKLAPEPASMNYDD